VERKPFSYHRLFLLVAVRFARSATGTSRVPVIATALAIDDRLLARVLATSRIAFVLAAELLIDASVPARRPLVQGPSRATGHAGIFEGVIALPLATLQLSQVTITRSLHVDVEVAVKIGLLDAHIEEVEAVEGGGEIRARVSFGSAADEAEDSEEQDDEFGRRHCRCVTYCNGGAVLDRSEPLRQFRAGKWQNEKKQETFECGPSRGWWLVAATRTLRSLGNDWFRRKPRTQKIALSPQTTRTKRSLCNVVCCRKRDMRSICSNDNHHGAPNDATENS